MANSNYTLSINIEEAEAVAREIQGTNGDLKNKLEEIANVINNMQNAWQSATSEGTVTKFNSLKDQFNAYYDRVNGFANFILNDVSEAYKSGEQTISVNTDNIQNARAQAN